MVNEPCDTTTFQNPAGTLLTAFTITTVEGWQEASMTVSVFPVVTQLLCGVGMEAKEGSYCEGC